MSSDVERSSTSELFDLVGQGFDLCLPLFKGDL